MMNEHDWDYYPTLELRRNVLSLDLESTAVKDFRDLNDVKANVVVVYDPLTEESWRFVRDEAQGVELETLPLDSLRDMLLGWYEQGRFIGGQNILGFDFPVLMGDSSLNVCDILQAFIDSRQYIDTAQYMKNKLGFRVSLKYMVNSTLGDDKIMDGADAPSEWLKGNYTEVIEYCEKDTTLWSNLHTFGVQNRFILLGGAKIPVDW
jgi:hypothetical protein